MKEKRTIIHNKPKLQLAIATAILAISLGAAIWGSFSYWYLAAILWLLCAVYYGRADSNILMYVYKDRLELCGNAEGEVQETISFDQIVSWNLDTDRGGNIIIIYNRGNEKNLVCTVNSPNAFRVAFVLNRCLKDKNYKLSKLNAPFKALGRALHFNRQN